MNYPPPTTIHVDGVSTTRKGWLALTDLQTNENLTVAITNLEPQYLADFR